MSRSPSPPPNPTGVLYRVDRESLNTLIEKYVSSLTTNTSEQERVQKLKQEYVTLRTKLTTLPLQLEYNALVPLGRRAVCPGKIIHTNEITCLLGDNWFVECSAAKAIELVNHRIAKLDEEHEGLKKEQELINNWKQEAERQLIETIGEGTVEIREDYNEDTEKRWRELHKESLRRHHQQLAKRRLEEKQEKSQSNQELWTRLDELEIQEELENYLEQEDISSEQSAKISSFISEPNRVQSIRSQKSTENKKSEPISRNNDNIASTTKEKKAASQNTKIEKTEAPPPKSLSAPTGKRRVKFSEDNIIHDISDDNNFVNHEKSEAPVIAIPDDSTMPTYPCFEPIMIRFKHSTLADLEDEDANTSGTEEEDQISQIVASPGQIVKVFGPTSICAISNKPLPKSILKPFAPPLVEKSEKVAQAKERKKISFAEEDDDDLLEDVTLSAISKVVTERVPVFTSLQLNEPLPPSNSETESEPSKPVSLFKMRRQQQSVGGGDATSPD